MLKVRIRNFLNKKQYELLGSVVSSTQCFPVDAKEAILNAISTMQPTANIPGGKTNPHSDLRVGNNFERRMECWWLNTCQKN